MVAGLSRKSQHINNGSSSNHFMLTRPTKDDVNDRNDCYFEEPQSSKPSLVLRPKNSPEGTIVTVSKTTKPSDGKTKKKGNKRASMNSLKAPVAVHADGGAAMNEAKRRYVLRPQIGYTSTSSGSMMFSPVLHDHLDPSQDEEQVVSGILDGITSLCLGPTSQAAGFQTGTSTSTTKPYRLSPRTSTQRRKKKVVYPIVSYPARLNCKKLVSERRATFHQNLFRPVSSDESSILQSVRA